MVDFDTNDLQLDIGATEGKRRGDERLRILLAVLFHHHGCVSVVLSFFFHARDHFHYKMRGDLMFYKTFHGPPP